MKFRVQSAGLAVLLLTAIGGAALAAPPQLVDPAPGAALTWLRKPNVAEIGRIFSQHNVMREASARVVCVIGPNGRPRDCVVVEETPIKNGMGAAMIEIMTYYKAAGVDSLGLPSEGQKVTLAFRRGPMKSP